MNLEELALAYELRQEGCCWKRIAQGLGCDPILVAAQVYHLVNFGIKKGLDGYERLPGRKAVYDMDTIRKADQMRCKGSSWEGTARELDADPQKLRTSHNYAVRRGLI